MQHLKTVLTLARSAISAWNSGTQSSQYFRSRMPLAISKSLSRVSSANSDRWCSSEVSIISDWRIICSWSMLRPISLPNSWQVLRSRDTISPDADVNFCDRPSGVASFFGIINPLQAFQHNVWGSRDLFGVSAPRSRASIFLVTYDRSIAANCQGVTAKFCVPKVARRINILATQVAGHRKQQYSAHIGLSQHPR